MAGKVITDYIKMQLFKKGGAIASDKAVKFSADALEKRLKAIGIDPNTLNSQTELKQLLAYVKQAEDQAFNQMYSGILSGDEAAKFLNKVFPKKGTPSESKIGEFFGFKNYPKKGEIIKFPQKRSFKEEIEAMRKSGDIVDEKDMVISEKITNRDMFKEANEKFNKTDVIADTIARITSMEPVAALKEANKVIGRKGIYKNLDETQSKKILKDTEDWIFQRDLSDRYDYKNKRPFRDDPDFDPDDPDYIQRMKDEDAPDDFAQGGIAKFYTGGMVDVEPNLSDIGHGSDALMARTRLVAPNSQATTSTGLNYLLAEDNDNIRVPFSTGKLAGGIDSAIEKNKALEKNIDLQKRMTDMLNKKYEDKIHGKHMTPMPRPREDIRRLDRPSNPELQVGPFNPLDNFLQGVPGTEDIYVEFDDGTIYYKDTGEYYNQEGKQIPSPSPGAKPVVETLEAAEGGRIGFSGGGGGDPRRRAFLKLLATLTGGVAGIKSGILGLGGKEGTKKAVTETVKQSVGPSGNPPPYFFNLVNKIKTLGDDTLASTDKATAKKYKDYVMEEDFAGNIEIIKKGGDDMYPEDDFMSYKVDDVPIKGKKGSTKVEEYEEFTARPDRDGKMKDIEPGVTDEVIEEAGDTTAMTLKKADGGIARMLGE